MYTGMGSHTISGSISLSGINDNLAWQDKANSTNPYNLCHRYGRVYVALRPGKYHASCERVVSQARISRKHGDGDGEGSQQQRHVDIG